MRCAFPRQRDFLRPPGKPALRRGRLSTLLAIALCFAAGTLPAAAVQVAVRTTEGLVHGILVLHTLAGKQVATGELIQIGQGSRVTSRLLFHFPDGSLHEESTVFTQRRRFRLVSYHLVQKGRTFKEPRDFSIEPAAGRVTVRTVDDDGKPEVHVEKMKLPDDLANGMILTLLKNISPETPSTTVSMVAPGSKPRVVKLIITPAHQDPFTTSGIERRATHYVIKVDIPGVAGVVAPLIGKQPPDSHVWILGGEAPAFVKSESFLFLEGPIWRMELVSPVWPPEQTRGK